MLTDPLIHKIDTRDLVVRLMAHPLYVAIRDVAALRCFMRAHVFCVWDFQSLVKALQRALTCIDVPWVPSADPEARRLINEIVLDEESDATTDGRHLSHYELYLEAMRECGADWKPVEGFVSAVQQGISLDTVLLRPDVPRGIASFVQGTLDIARSGETHRIAAMFAYSREEIIPDMFRRFVEQLAEGGPQQWSTLLYYLDRHITQDTERHGPHSKALMARLCGDDAAKWKEAEAAARAGLMARLTLWDSILSDIHAMA